MAQKIQVLNPSGLPVSQAVVMLRDLAAPTPEVLLTNFNGEVEVRDRQTATIITISHISHHIYSDTLFNLLHDITITLRVRDINLKEVVVTSEYLPRTAGESVHPIMVISKSEIDNRAASSLGEVLEQQLNMRVSQDQLLGSGLTMNGLSGQHIKFLVDGVPVIGRLDGNIDISQLNLSHIERIEVVNGPMAASYGTDASGGVINLITKQQAQNRAEAQVNLFHESSGHYNADGLAGFNTGASSVLMSGGRNYFDGWSPADTGRWQEWKPKEQLFGNARYRYSCRNLIIGYSLNMFHEVVSNKGTPKISPYFAYAFDEYYKTTRLTNQVNTSWMSGNYTVGGTASYSRYNRVKNTYRKDLVTLGESLVPDAGQQDTTTMDSWMIRATFTGNPVNGGISYQAGIDFQIDNAMGTRFKDDVKVLGDYAFFASGEFNISRTLQAKPAIRFAHNTDYKSPVIPSVMFRYQVTTNTIARFSYGKGFRAPGIKERYLYFVDINHNIRGNEDLLPEYSDNFFLSLNREITIGKIKNAVELSGFYNDVRNAITLAQPDPSQSLYTYINLGKFSTHGGSITNTFTLKRFTAGLGFSYTGRYNIYADSGDFKKYIYSPDLNARLQYVFQKANLTASIYFKYNGKLPGYRLNSDNTISQFSNDSYRFLDASLRKGIFNKRLYVTAGAKNILDVTRINAIASGTAHSGGTDEIAVGTGRSYFVKIQLLLTK